VDELHRERCLREEQPTAKRRSVRTR
jgi:hypothetical protein